MSNNLMAIALILGLILLAVAAWLNNNPIVDALFIFAAFVIGGVWSKQTGRGNE